jgi:hypothetical protein
MINSWHTNAQDAAQSECRFVRLQLGVLQSHASEAVRLSLWRGSDGGLRKTQIPLVVWLRHSCEHPVAKGH